LPREISDPLRELAEEPPIAQALPRLDAIRSEVVVPLQAAHPDVHFCFDLSRLQALDYYRGPTVRIGIGDRERPAYAGDGGFVDWTQRLLVDRKERFFSTAMGTEFLVKQLAPKPAARRAAPSIEVATSGIWQLSSVILSSRGRSWLIDPGYFPREVAELASRAAARGPTEVVVFTHGHWDHVVGWRAFRGAKVMGSERLSRAVAAGEPTAAKDLAGARDFDGRWYVERPIDWPPEIQPLREGDRATLGDLEIEALILPGHSADGVGLWIAERGALICGDYLSPLEIPFVDDLAAYAKTLRRLIAFLDQVELVIPGHGPALDRASALAIAREDLAYLEAIAAATDAEAALAVPLPRAAAVPGMLEHHRENVAKRPARQV
jgi:glyoxylase-like metal-dependent hydrolase (beta-lactamase superfamily II)